MTDQSPRAPQPPQTPAADGGMNQGMRVLSALISGVLLYGALGWLGDHFLRTEVFLPIGIVLGAAFGAYVSVKRLTATLAAEPTVPRPRETRTRSADNSEGEER